MTSDEELSKAHRSGNCSEMHRILDEWATHGSVDPFRITYWRAVALMAERRFQEALDLLRARKNDYHCKTPACTMIARTLHSLERDNEATAELKNAPMASELDRYRPLVIDAKFQLAYLQALNGLPVEEKLLGEIPDAYIHLGRGKRISKMELLTFISKGASSAQSPGASPLWLS